MRVMLHKTENDDTDIGGIMKKVIIGAAFLLVLPIAVPVLTGVDIYELCISDGDGGCKEPATSEGEANKLRTDLSSSSRYWW